MKLKIFISGLVLLIFAINCKESAIESVTLELKTPQLKSAVTGTNYYVATAGNDSNAGTPAAPFLTIQKGLDSAQAGDTVFVKAGTYTHSRFFNSGTAANPITLKNYKNDVVTIDAASGYPYCLYASGISYISVKGINCKDATAYIMEFYNCDNITVEECYASMTTKSNLVPGIELANTTRHSNYLIKNCAATNCRNGVSIRDAVSHAIILGGTFTFNSINVYVGGTYPLNIPTIPMNISIDSVYCSNSNTANIGTEHSQYVTIKNCHTDMAGSTGIQIEEYSYDAIVEDNLCQNGSRYYGYETGIWVYNSPNTIVRRNIIKNNQVGLRLSSATNFAAYSNLIAQNTYDPPVNPGTSRTGGVDFNTSSGTFYNNTLVGNSNPASSQGSIFVYPDGVSNIIIKNNIVMNDGSAQDMGFQQPAGSTITSDYNLVYNANRAINIGIINTWWGYFTWSAYKEITSQDAHSIIADPIFVGPADYSLQTASPAVNAGVNVGLTSDFQGNPIIGLPDIGAYEATTLSAPAITSYYNTEISATATKNSCEAGYTGSTVTYTVAAGKYSSTVSQAAADILAAADLNTNTQTYANANGTCTLIPVYYNTQISASATKNSCEAGYTGSTVNYTVAAGKYSSTISQVAADNLASADLNTNTQTYANANGNCTLIPVYYNTQISATATKNSCGAGYTGSTVNYTVAAGKYSSTISQVAADNLASTDLNTNTQTYANANGTCTLIPVYYNTQISATATKNSCGAGYTGSTVNYTVAAGKYSSTVSQAAADNLASTDLNTNTQTYANANGTCTLIPVYYNTQISATATKNSCGAGYTGSTVNYTVSAGKYSSTVSQAAVDNLASTDLNTNTQSYANANGTCTAIPVYYNTQASASATKNNCGTGYTGSTVTYTVAAGKYSSTVSQAAANTLATTDLNANTQTYANTNGTCTLVPVKVYYNVVMSATATKNNCGKGLIGSTVTYTIAAKTYSSTVSQTAANNLAITALRANKQAYANANGTCTSSKLLKIGH